MSMPAIRAAALRSAVAATDLRNSTVTNRLACSGALLGALWYGVTGSSRGGWFSLTTAAVGFGSLVGFPLLGVTGCGDVKLLAAFGGLTYWRVWRNRMRQGGMAQGEFIPNAPAIVSVAGLTLWAN